MSVLVIVVVHSQWYNKINRFITVDFSDLVRLLAMYLRDSLDNWDALNQITVAFIHLLLTSRCFLLPSPVVFLDLSNEIGN